MLESVPMASGLGTASHAYFSAQGLVFFAATVQNGLASVNPKMGFILLVYRPRRQHVPLASVARMQVAERCRYEIEVCADMLPRDLSFRA